MVAKITITDRTKSFAIRIIKACSFLDEGSSVCRTLSKQLLRSGTSIGANVREAQSAQSEKDFIMVYTENNEHRCQAPAEDDRGICNVYTRWQRLP